MSDIYNGAAGYIRTNPKATLGLTAIVVVIMQVITLIATVGPLTALNQLENQPSTELSLGVFGAWMGSVAASGLVTWLGGMLLSGILTVVVGRAVFGSPITIGEAWARVRGRVLALIGLALLEAAGMVALGGLVVVILVGVAAAVNGAAAVLVGIPLLLLVGLLLAYLYTMLVFAPVLIVLERLPLVDAVIRSFRLVRGGFWRVLGIRLLTALVVGLVGGAVAAPSASRARSCWASPRRKAPSVCCSSARRCRPSAQRSARSSPHRSPPELSCCCTPIAACAPKPSTWSCRPVPPVGPPQWSPPTTCGSRGLTNRPVRTD
ncbi:hypothetical protein NIIDMKKI_81010 [Mycobacterium kansasii]|uniref:Transmembrane protein n=1 Tax=Mycobacterium kansasii TaxID=1768 RepID=A0A7G1ISW6_MYCKA|nr:hypothetical protein NIIDMKKI_81010 [Mycobacterium kansasii]